MIAVAVGIVVVLAFLVFFFLRKRNQEDDTAYLPNPKTPTQRIPSDNPKLEELLQDAEEAASIPPAPSAAPSVSPLEKIDLLTQDQRYDEAIAELKRFLMTNPKEEQAMLKLLQIYGITNNRNAFHGLHSKIHEIGSPDLIEQADFCRSLLEDDLVEAPKSKPASDEVKIDMLDFEPTQAPEALEPQVTYAQPQAQIEPEESSFELEDFGFDDIQATSEAHIDTSSDEAVISNEVEADFDFNFEETTTESTPSDDSTFELDDFSLDDDLSFEPSSAQETPLATTNELDSSTLSDGLDLDNLESDDVELDLSESIDSLSFDEPTPSNTQAQSDGDFDFDLGDDALLQNDTSSSEYDNASTDEDVLDLGLEDLSLDDLQFGDSSQPAQHDETVATSDFDLDVSFDQDISFDEPPSESLPAEQSIDSQASHSDTEDNTFALDDLALDDLDFTQESQEAQEPLVAPTFEQPTPSQEEFVADTVALADDEATKASDALFDDSHGVEDQPKLAEDKPTAEPTAPSLPLQPVGDLPTVGGDTPKITLELAQQYLNLGEQDSAKRLLQEVSKMGTPEQQQTANALLARL